MTRVFLRFYIGILVSFAITMIAVVGWLLWETPDDRDVVSRALRGGVALAHERLSRLPPDERGGELASLTETFRYDVVVGPLEKAPLSESAKARLRAEETVVEGNFVHRAIDGDNVLTMGPLPTFQFGSGGGWVVGFVVLAWAAASFLLLRPVFRSTRELETAASAMAAGDLSARIEPSRVSFARLAASFNSMAETTERLVSDQRELLAAVSHEFRTPLARLRFASDLVASAGDEERGPLLAEIDANVSELETLVAELLDAVRVDHGGVAASGDPFELDQVVPALLRTFEGEAVEVVWRDEAGELGELGGERLFARALRNLVANGCRHASSAVEVVTETSGGALWVRVSDDGPGIAAADRERALKPFVQLGNAEDGGSGLGLAIVARIVHNRGGDIAIDAARAGGARVSFSWPLGGCGSAVA